MKASNLLILLGVAVLLVPTYCFAERVPVAIERAEGSNLAKAVGHFARARSLLNAAVREFDKGAARVDPSSLLNTEAWRNTLIDRAEDLERVLDPQPRATKGGVRFNPDTRLLGEFSEAQRE